MSTLRRLALAAPAIFFALPTLAQIAFEDLPPSAQRQWIKPIPTTPQSLRLQAPIILAPQAPVEGGIQNPFFSECVFYDDFGFFTPQPDDVGEPPMLVPLQDGLVGVTWETNRDFIGMANDALFTALGGTPPTGLTPNGDPIERYIAFARETLGQGPITTFSLGMNARAFSILTPSFEHPVQATQFVQMQTDDGVPDTSLWWSPLSFQEGFVLTRVFFGGKNLGGLLGAFENAELVLDRFVTLGPGSGQTGQFFAPPVHPLFDFPTDEWFIIMTNMSQQAGGGVGWSVWVKTAQSANSSPTFLDPRMSTGDIVAPDGDPTGWVDVFPGFIDNAQTPDVIEGIGRAITQFNQPAPTNGAFGQSSLLAAISLDGVQFGVGLDPLQFPTNSPNDYFFGPICFNGTPFEQPCVIPDFTLPYSDSLEDFQPGALIRTQTTRWFDDDASNAIISSTQNTTPGGSQSLAQQNVQNDNQLRAMFGTALPPGSTAKPGKPIVASVKVRMSPTLRTGRMVVLHDRERSGDVNAFIALGGTDPSGPFAQADGQLYVRQPNPSFDTSQSVQDQYMQMHWINPEDWLLPPSPPLNLRYLLVPAGVNVLPIGQFHEIQVEIEPVTLDSDEPPSMRIFFNGSEIFPYGDPQQSWVAGSRTANSFEFWSSASVNGEFDILHVDDVMFDGDLDEISAGPPFTTPYAEDFESYQSYTTINGQGSTPFLDPASVPFSPVSQNEPQITILPAPMSMPEAGEPVCRYQLVENCLDPQGLLPPVESVIAISAASLPPLQSGANAQCPALAPTPLFTSRLFEVRDSETGDRIGVGRWTLVDQGQVAFDPGAGDVTGFDFFFTNEPVWRIATPRNQGLVVTDPLEGVNQVLSIENIDGNTNAATATNLFPSVEGLLPEVIASPENFPNAEMLNELTFDLYIESLNVDGLPVVAAPRTRLGFAVDSSGPSGARIAEFVFGGPNSPNFVSPENISYLNENGAYVNSGRSLITPGAPFSGPLVNTWLRVIFTSDHQGDWTLSIDEDRDGSAPPVQVAEGNAVGTLEGASPGIAGINSFTLRQGRDFVGCGRPVTPPRTVRLRSGGATSVGPPDADPNEDYCFYEVSFETFASPFNLPQIAEVQNDLTGLITGFRALEEGDVIAVLNRRTNPNNTVAGQPLVHDLCPALAFDEIEQFNLLNEDGSEFIYAGRWKAMGLPGEAGLMSPEPAGGITRPNGPLQNPPVSYNNPTAEPPGYPGALIGREILLADWANDEFDGAAAALPALPPARWYIDNLALRNVSAGAPCADISGDSDVVNGDDLATLLSTWGASPKSAADYNGDGVVNGDDLATLLANWGPCPE